MELTKNDIIFAIKLRYGTIRKFAEKVGVSPKMIHLYIDEYYLPGIRPKWTRRKDSGGSYYRFLSLLKRALKQREDFLKKMSKRFDIPEDQMQEIIDVLLKELRG